MTPLGIRRINHIVDVFDQMTILLLGIPESCFGALPFGDFALE